MRKSFYPKMAWSGISHNRKLYIPYFFTCIAMVMMFYIIDALSVSNVLVQIRGGETMQSMLNLGKWIIGLFTLIFLFYTNSFLNKRRSREYGLYNVLGMDKRNRDCFFKTCRIVDGEYSEWSDGFQAEN